MEIGKKIKELRKKKNLTQADLADRLHVTYQAVSRWENDNVQPSLDTIKELATIFECSVDDLLDLEKEPREHSSVSYMESTQNADRISKEHKRLYVFILLSILLSTSIILLAFHSLVKPSWEYASIFLLFSLFLLSFFSCLFSKNKSFYSFFLTPIEKVLQLPGAQYPFDHTNPVYTFIIHSFLFILKGITIITVTLVMLVLSILVSPFYFPNFVIKNQE